MIYRDSTLGLVAEALEESTEGASTASDLIKNLLEKKATVVCSLPKPMMALLHCLHETGLWGFTIEEVLERLAANQLRRILEDDVKTNEWFPGGVRNIVDSYSADGDKDESE